MQIESSSEFNEWQRYLRGEDVDSVGDKLYREIDGKYSPQRESEYTAEEERRGLVLPRGGSRRIEVAIWAEFNLVRGVEVTRSGLLEVSRSVRKLARHCQPIRLFY